MAGTLQPNPISTDFAQQLVHNEGDTGHIAGVFQHGQEEKQSHNDRQEAEHTSHAGKHAVDDQRMDHRIDAVGGQPCVHPGGDLINAQREQIAQKASNDAKGQPKYQKHDQKEHGNRQIFSRENLVDAHAAHVLPALAVFEDGVGTQLFNKGIAHVRQRGFPVRSQFRFHLLDGMLRQLQLVFRQLQLLNHGLIAFHQLGGGKAGRHTDGGCVVFHHMGQ